MAILILVVDHDPIERRLLEATTRRFGYEVEATESGESALARMKAMDRPPVNLVLLDLATPDLDGMSVLRRMREHGIHIPAIVQTTPASIETVIFAMRAGAIDFVVKPVGGERLKVSIENALRVAALENELHHAIRRNAGELAFRDMVIGTDPMSRIVSLSGRAAKSNIPVLIEGEPGVGKELMARAIQGSSERRGKPFVAVNCGALPEALIESTLFGHERGAFAGATEKRAGKFVEANGGTLFLDEIDELPPNMQAKLLRALKEGEIDPIGAKRPVKVDVRLLSATKESLIELVKTGRFREDLFYRLNVYPISIPPLRSRAGDVPELAARFLARFCADQGKRIRAISPEALALLCAYDWPGNVRQLENAVFRAVVLADGDELTVAEFPQIAARVEGFPIRIPPAPPPAPAQRENPRFADTALIEPRDPHALRLIDDYGEVRKLEELEAESIRFALAHYRGQMSQVARKLGIGRSTLYRKMRESGIEDAAAGEAQVESEAA